MFVNTPGKESIYAYGIGLGAMVATIVSYYLYQIGRGVYLGIRGGIRESRGIETNKPEAQNKLEKSLKE